MINAKEAMELADDFNESAEILEAISSQITRAAKLGKYEIILPYVLKNKYIKEELKRNGFIFNYGLSFKPYHRKFTKISWSYLDIQYDRNI